MFNGFYQGKRVLVTGHTGFKGAWLALWLKHLGANVHGVSLPPPTQPNLYEVIRSSVFTGDSECDIRNLDPLAAVIKAANPEVVFHLAAQPIVRRSYTDPLETLHSNVLGTAHVLESIRMAQLSSIVVVVTSDKCYENREWEFAYRENDPLGGHDVYSMSKAATELVAHSWNKSFFLTNASLGPVVTVRAGNVIGGGDYAADRIVPDCVRALMLKKPVLVRNPTAIRPWQHVLECLSGYLWLAARLSLEPKTSTLVSPFNFGPEPSARQPVKRLVEEILSIWPGTRVDGSDPNSPHEATLLTLSIEKAVAKLGWQPVWGFKEAIERTISWYFQRHMTTGADMLKLSQQQILDYAEAARGLNLVWAG